MPRRLAAAVLVTREALPSVSSSSVTLACDRRAAMRLASAWSRRRPGLPRRAGAAVTDDRLLSASPRSSPRVDERPVETTAIADARTRLTDAGAPCARAPLPWWELRALEPARVSRPGVAASTAPGACRAAARPEGRRRGRVTAAPTVGWRWPPTGRGCRGRVSRWRNARRRPRGSAPVGRPPRRGRAATDARAS